MNKQDSNLNRAINKTGRLIQLIRSNIRQRGLKSVFSTIWRMFKRDGVMGIIRRLSHARRNNYLTWIAHYDTLNESKRRAILKQIQAMPNSPLISIVLPVYNPPVHLLDEAIWSIRNQLYPNWELCIADDASKTEAVLTLLTQHAAEDSRIKVTFRTENGHICQSSNSALEWVTGEFVALMDHDDLLPEHALFWVADAIINHPDAGIIYSDEDKIDLKGVRQDPYFKPDWNHDLFLSHNLISHLGVYRTTLLREINGFRIGFEGSQDYDLALRCIDRLQPQQIIHIPRVLYHWRIHPLSTASSMDAKPYATLSAEKALNDYLNRNGISGQAYSVKTGYRVQYALPESPPLVSLIIPTRNGLHLLQQCLDSILTKTIYPNYELIIIDNGSDDPEILKYFKSIENDPNEESLLSNTSTNVGLDRHSDHVVLSEARNLLINREDPSPQAPQDDVSERNGSQIPTIRIIRDDQPFNYSALNNAAVKLALGSVIGLINNDIEVISPDWLSEMVSLALQPNVGAVGAKLWYPNDTLQHGGVVVGLGGVAGHSHKHFSQQHAGYCGRTSLLSNYSAVTAACLVIKKSIYTEVGGLNELELKVAFNDVDFCLKVRKAGYRNVWTPYAELYHHESVSRGTEATPEKKARFMQEVQYMQTHWGDTLQIDPAYSPNLTIHHEDFSLAWPPRL